MDHMKLNACTFTSVYLDMVHDFAAPGQYLIPFVFEEPEFMVQVQDDVVPVAPGGVIEEPCSSPLPVESPLSSQMESSLKHEKP